MSLLTELSQQLSERLDLTREQVAQAAEALASAEVAEQEKVLFLSRLSDKGESAQEVVAFAEYFRERAVDPGVGEWASRAIDIVGTGGDHAGGFNISSIVVLVLASAGVPVMKHGNRGVTSKCGSADLLGAFGFDLSATPERQREALRQLGYVFFFAPSHHPSFKHIAPVRKTLAAQGRRSVFNILGPLINPGRPAHTLLGVFSAAWVPVLADALTGLGSKSGLAVHGVIGEGRGIDELTTATDNLVAGAGSLSGFRRTWQARDFGIEPCDFSELIGGDLQQNLAIVDALLSGKGPVGLGDTIALNAAAGLWLTGRVSDVKDGVGMARELLLGGAVKSKIAATREFFTAKV